MPARDGQSAGPSPPPLGMRSSRVAGAGLRAAPRPGDRRYSAPARDARRDLPGAGWRERGYATPAQVVERVAPDGFGTALLGVALRAIWGRPGAPWLVVGAVALFLGGELLQLVTGHVIGPWRDLWVIGAAGSAAAASAWVALRSGRLLDSLWGWVAAGCAVWEVGALVRAVQPSAVRSGSDPLLLADLGFLGLTPLFLAGVAVAFPSGPTTLPRVRLIIDAVVLPAALGLLAYLLIGREGGAQPAADLHVLLAVAYPVAYLSLALGTILGYRRVEAAGAGRAALGAGRAGGGRRVGSPGASGLPSGYLIWAALAFVPGAGLLAWATLAPHGLLRLGADACFIAGFTLVAIEALETLGGTLDARRGARGRREVPRPAPLWPWRSSGNLPLAGTAAAAAVLVVATLELLVVRDVRPAIYLGSVGLLALVLSRQFITLVDNARLIARLRVAGELEARLREVGLAVSRSLEQPAVLELICQAGQRVFQADTVILWRADARQQALEIVAAVGDPAREFVGRRLDLRNDQALAVRVFLSRKTERVAHALPVHRSDGFLTTATRSQALLGVPLVSNQQPLGVLLFGNSRDPDAFVPDDVIKGELLAGQAVVAIENAKLYGDLARRADEAESLYQLSAATQHARSAGDVACALLEVLRHRLGFCHAAVYLTGGVGRSLVPLAVAQDEGPIMPVESGARPLPTVISGLSTQLVDGTLRRVVSTGEPARLDGAPRTNHQFLHEGMQVRLTVPLKLGDQVLGVVDLETNQPQAYSDTGGGTVRSLAHGAALTIQNLRLVEEARHVETLRELDRLKSELLQTVSHELRTPLASIKGFTTTMLEHDRKLSREEKREYLEIIDQESDRLRGLIEDLLDMSKIEAGVLQLDRQAVMVGKLASEAIKTVASHSPEHRFEASVPADLLADADPRRIRQVLQNLLENAVKYSPDGGTIQVSGERIAAGTGATSGGWVAISVRDQGIGIPRGDLTRVFDRFHRVNTDVGQRVGGSGLGLAICRGIVEAHGGRIWAESEPGAGSTFTFTLPLAVELVATSYSAWDRATAAEA